MSDPEQKDATPESFGRFKVTGVLGRGGMGIVYLAEDPLIGRRVAIKVLRPDPGLEEDEQSELQSRFEQEFRSAGTLSHPNVVTIYDVGKQREGAFIAMECIEGQSLSDLINSGKVLSFKEISDLAMQVCSALDYAHAAGIVHRDVKPANILVNSAGHPKITDFGVAKVVSANLTRTGTVIGTPTYMSPEQVTGQPITGASDQWSMGVILYQMLTGELPFGGESPTTILYKIVHQDPIGPQSLNRSLPATVDGVLLRALQKNPRDRYNSCTAMAEDLRTALGAAPVIPVESTSRTVTLTQSDLTVASGSYGGAASWWQRQNAAPRIGLVAGAGLLVAALGWFVAANVLRDKTVEVPVEPPGSSPQLTVSAPAPFSGSVRVSSDRGGGAEIWRNGQDTQRITPSDVPLEGTEGDNVHLELRRFGQTVAETDLTLTPDLPPWSAQESPLAPVSYGIASQPAGARVIVNGRTLDQATPATVELEYGKRYQLRVELDGHVPKPWSFEFPSGLPKRVRTARQLFFNLEASVAPGTVTARARYPIILEAGGRRSGPSPEPRLELAPGSHRVKVSAPSVYYETFEEVTVESGGTVRLPTLPEAIPIRVLSVPENATVYVDGQLLHNNNVSVTAGWHEFRFEFLDGSIRVQRFRVSRGNTTVFERL